MTISHPARRRRFAAATLLVSAGAVAAFGPGGAAPANASVSGAPSTAESGQVQEQNRADDVKRTQADPKFSEAIRLGMR